MDLLGVVLAFLTGLVVGALVVYVRSSAPFRRVETERFTLEKRLESAEADRARLSQEVEESKVRERGLWEKLREETCRRAAAEENARRVHELENRVGERDKELLELSSRLADLQARPDEERKGIEEKTALLRDAQLILQDTFRTVAAEALQLNNQAFLQLATENLERFQQGAQMDLEIRRKAVDELVGRIEDGLSRLQAKLDELEQERVSSHSALNQRIQDLLEVHFQLRSETANLVKALRQPAARGRWGELQLRRVVEIAGMQPPATLNRDGYKDPLHSLP
jgi:DNA recombination protein RmuC